SGSDAYYGHEEPAKLASAFITNLFACPELPPPSSANPSSPSPTLAQFIAYSLHRTRLHSSVTFAALFLLNRLKGRFPAARGSSGHRLFISAFMIASKIICDDTYSNKSWCVVGQGMFSLREINQMEREMCAYLEWVLTVPKEELEVFEAELKKEYGADRSPKTMLPIVTASSLPTPPRSAAGSVVSLAAAAGLATPPMDSMDSMPRAAHHHSSPSDDKLAYPSPEASPISLSPSHSDSSTPASSTCQTPPSVESSSPMTEPDSAMPKSIKTGGRTVPRIVRDPSFAFAAP
ncbi:hypothetical protein BOTBODRAFT_33598, partial [Botryobasidium botryosum FD-172 SS1]